MGPCGDKGGPAGARERRWHVLAWYSSSIGPLLELLSGQEGEGCDVILAQDTHVWREEELSWVEERAVAAGCKRCLRRRCRRSEAGQLEVLE